MPNHHIRLDTFIVRAEQAQQIIETLNRAFFDGKLKYELIVLPPEAGTFLSKLKVAVLGGVGAALMYVNTDVGKAYVFGLTGRDPVYWADRLGEITAGKAASAFEEIDGIISPLIDEDEPESPKAPAASEACSALVVEMTRGILEREMS